MSVNPASLNKCHVRRRFDRAAAGFDDVDYVHRASFDGLIERLSPVIIEPKLILDLGSATGTGSRQLGKQFRKSAVISLDASSQMLRISAARHSSFSRIREVRADAARIPLPTGSVDLVIANMLLPWMDNLPAFFAEIARVLKKGGLFAFATLGPDSFAEFRQAWAAIDALPHVHVFPDMHIVGDALLQAGLGDPILDVDKLIVTFPGIIELQRDLEGSGARNCLQDRRQTLTGASRYRAMQREFHHIRKRSPVSLELELVYGHAWGRGPGMPAGEFHVEPGAIARHRRI